MQLLNETTSKNNNDAIYQYLIQVDWDLHGD